MMEKIIDTSISRNYKEVLKAKEKERWIEAMKIEYDSVMRNDTFLWKRKQKQDKVLPSKWVFMIKRDVEGEVTRFKTRLCAGGHKQKYRVDFRETYALVAKFVSLRILLTRAGLENWESEQGDIVTAFLYGDLEEKVMMKVPEGVYIEDGERFIDGEGVERVFDKKTKEEESQNMVWELKKSIYGLKQSPRCFYNKLDGVMVKKGYKKVQADYGVWVHEKGVMIVHVDDMLILGTEGGIGGFKETIEEVFQVRWLGQIDNSAFVGLRIKRDRENRRIMISQDTYALAILKKFGMENANECATPMDPKEDWPPKEDSEYLDEAEKKTYQAAIGSLIYLMLGS